jgi:hypothetical protein
MTIVSGSAPQQDFHRVCCFVDGAYVRKRLTDLGVAWQDIDLKKLGQHALASVGSERWEGRPFALSRVFAYDAIPDRHTGLPQTSSPNQLPRGLRAMMRLQT